MTTTTTTGIFLTVVEVRELTGRQQFQAQRRVLAENGIPFTCDAQGRPIVPRVAIVGDRAVPSMASPSIAPPDPIPLSEPDFGAIAGLRVKRRA